MIKIRSLEKSDIPSAEYICLITAAREIKDTTKKALRTLLMYNRCYTRTQNSSSFVAEDEDGRVVGYILCAESLCCSAAPRVIPETPDLPDSPGDYPRLCPPRNTDVSAGWL